MSDPAHKNAENGETADGRVRSIAWLGRRPRCRLTEKGLACIGDGNAGCGWHGCESAASEKQCRYLWDDRIGITGYVLDGHGDDSVWLCPKCGGECAHTPIAEVLYGKDEPCACVSRSNVPSSAEASAAGVEPKGQP